MATVTFDTLKLVDKLKAAGIPAEQAEAVVRVIADALDESLGKRDLNEFKLEMTARFERLDGELRLNRWMLGIIVVAEVGPFLATLFQ
jgi:hypothetical protein